MSTDTGTPPGKSRKQRQRERQQERDTALRETVLRDQADRARLRQLEDQRQRDMQELRTGAQLGPEAARLAQAIEQAERDMQELRERMARRVERLTPARRARFERMRETMLAEEVAKKAQRRRKLTPEERAERRRKALAAMQYTAQLAIQRNNERRAAMTPEQREREAQRAEEARQAIERERQRVQSDREYYRQSLKHATALRREQRKREHEEAMAAAIRVRDAERHYHAVRDAAPRPPYAQAQLAAERERQKAAKAFAREYFALVRRTERAEARARAQAQAPHDAPRKTTEALVQEIAFTVPASVPLHWIGVILCRYLRASLVPIGYADSGQLDDFQRLTGYVTFALRPPYGVFAALPADESPFAGHHVAFFPDGKAANITAWLERALPRAQAARAHLARLHSARAPDGRVAWRLSWADYPPHGKCKRDVDTATLTWQAPAWAIGVAQPLHEAVLRSLYATPGVYDLHRGVTLDVRAVPPGQPPVGTVRLHGQPVAHARGIGNDAIVTPVIPIPAASPRGKTPSDVLEALGVDVALLTE